MFGWTQSLFLSTLARTANFASGSEAGQVMLLTVAVPEPATLALALGAVGVLCLVRCSRRRLKANAPQGSGRPAQSVRQ